MKSINRICLFLMICILGTLLTGCGSKYKAATDEIINSEKKLFEQKVTNVKYFGWIKNESKEAYNARKEQYKKEMTALKAEEMKILATIEGHNAKFDEIKALAKEEKINENDVNSFINSVKQARIDWVKKISFERMQGDTIKGVGSGSTWEEVQIVFGKPIESQSDRGMMRYKYDGLEFYDGSSKGAPLPGQKWESYGPSIWEMTNPIYVTDGGAQIGMSLRDVSSTLAKNGSFAVNYAANDIMCFEYALHNAQGKSTNKYPVFAFITNYKLSRYAVSPH